MKNFSVLWPEEKILKLHLRALFKEPKSAVSIFLQTKQLEDRWTFVKLYTQKNDFWAPDGDRTRNLLMTGETL